MKTKVKDTYQASFYMLFGAEFVRVTKIQLSNKKITKLGWKYAYVIHLDNVNPWTVLAWHSGTAYCNIFDFTKKRLKLKKLIKEYESQTQYKAKTVG